jgi:hypothetical protein
MTPVAYGNRNAAAVSGGRIPPSPVPGPRRLTADIGRGTGSDPATPYPEAPYPGAPYPQVPYSQAPYLEAHRPSILHPDHPSGPWQYPPSGPEPEPSAVPPCPETYEP